MGYNPTVEEWEFLNPVGEAQGRLVISTMAQNRSALFSNATEEQQQNHEQKTQSHATAGVITPRSAMGPDRERANQQKHQHNKEKLPDIFFSFSDE